MQSAVLYTSAPSWLKVVASAAFMAALTIGGPVSAAPVTFTQLSGTTGGSPAETAVFRGNLAGLGMGQIASITIQDNSSGLGGSPGQFSGFDLDAIVISRTLITSASQVATLVPAVTFSFATSVLTPGTQRAPASPALFGTSGGKVNDAVATLDKFDGNATTTIPGAFGFVSLGDKGSLSINLTSLLTLSSPLYLYIGEVGNNGEVAASSVTVNATPVPEPASMAVLAAGLLGWGATRRRRERKAARAS